MSFCGQAGDAWVSPDQPKRFDSTVYFRQYRTEVGVLLWYEAQSFVPTVQQRVDYIIANVGAEIKYIISGRGRDHEGH